jgi:hypothetical protein
LNEGLAQYFEGKDVDPRQMERLRQLAQAGKVPALTDLEGSFLGLNGPQATYAYLLSLTAVRHMVDRYGMYRVKMVLEELSTGSDASRAIDKALLISLPEFERGWKRSLE